jgi:DNA-binding GntR family transcriptional regulator
MDLSESSPRALAPALLRRRASDALRSAIVEGRLRPGDRLMEGELAQQLGVSRAPVREALRELEHEGLVTSSPYRATEVLGVSQDEIAEVLVPIRLTLEAFAFRRAFPLLSAEDFATLGQLVGRMRRAAARDDLDELAADDVRFHELVIERSGQPHCLQIWRSIEPRVRAYFRRDAPAHPGADELAEEHEQLLRALQTRDEAQILETLARHIHRFFGPSAGEDAPGVDAATTTATRTASGIRRPAGAARDGARADAQDVNRLEHEELARSTASARATPTSRST